MRHGVSTASRASPGVASTVLAPVRARDVVGRFGGEEFVVFLEHEAVAEPVVIGKRTASIGGAVSGVLGEQSLNELVDIADSPIYAAKRNGRNRVFCEPMTCAGPRRLRCGPRRWRSSAR
jgi:PleD family two-component response regulator